MKVQCIVLLMVLLGVNTTMATDNQCEGDNELLTDLGQRYEIIPSITINKQVPREKLHHKHPPARYLRVFIEPIEITKKGWRLSIRDRDYRPLQTFGPEDFESESGTNLEKLWTRRLPGTMLHFDLVFSDLSVNASFKVREYIAMPERADNPFYSMQTDVPEWTSLFENDPRVPDFSRRLGDVVGFLMGSRIPKSWCCSGVVITTKPVLFLTNFHCGGLPHLATDNYWTPQICKSTLIDLSWDEDGQSREYSCQEVVMKDPVRDIAILRIKAVDPDSAPIPPIIRSRPISDQELINIIHHPACETKKISTKCQVVQAAVKGWRDESDPDLDFTHICDTENGSSGAPIFDQEGFLVGLHHLGFAEDPDTGKCDKLNKAIRMDKILGLLESEHPGIVSSLRLQQ